MRTTRVAVRAVTSGVVGAFTTHTEAWKILAIPTDYVGDFDAEASAIIEDHNTNFVGHVIVVDEGVDGFAAGCATWSGYWDDDLAISEPTERDVAAQQHRGCEHTLFGATPAEGWTRETDPDVLAAHNTVELWTLRTGECALGEYAAIVTRSPDSDTFRLSVFRDERGPLCELVPTHRLDAAKALGVATIVAAIAQV
ncbi:hypothetical protein [Nocardia sp. XZ_19_369]|uniref:hypothetical protein n=1 Tax=Nocardia sp. XZ_19_369 TaxID=2769487 RepID=UPI00188FCA37|nr:hypothetical protein [Nocardia sp. XZ_19_369]